MPRILGGFPCMDMPPTGSARRGRAGEHVPPAGDLSGV